MEAELIRWLEQHVPRHRALRLPLGDDTALVEMPSPAGVLVTVDLLSAGVDFLPDQVDLQRVGRKALAVNLSDIAAMGGKPTAAVVALALPREGALAQAQRLYAGILPLAAEYDVAIAGGDTNTWEGQLVIAVTVLGQPHARGLLRRDGARTGDVILVTGRFGGSILGKQFDFNPRVREIARLLDRYQLHAAIDVSDGLALDASRMAAASGCGIVLDTARVPIDPAAEELARRDGRSPLEHALGDGEDFELVLAAPPEEAARMLDEQPLEVPLTAIGHCAAEVGLWSIDATGQQRPLPATGYEHPGT
ncbi:MAG: thiamine-phosphate kinase [Pirellulales bacterium]|nr:thiamine-phosphate kinase [Pirellulales bacterium]